MSPFDNEFKEIIRLRKSQCLVAIVKKYREIMYERKKLIQTDHTQSLDKEMIKTVDEELSKLLGYFE